MRTASLFRPLGLLAALALAACGTTPPPAETGAAPPPPAGASCEADPARVVVGQVASASVVEDARRRAGAHMARVIRPGQAVTLEYNASRLNLDVDASGKVVGVRCG